MIESSFRPVQNWADRLFKRPSPEGGKAILHYEAIRQLTHDYRQQREHEAQIEHLALQARTRRQRRARRIGAGGRARASCWAARRHAAEHTNTRVAPHPGIGRRLNRSPGARLITLG